jgi:hypothetical protein
VPLGLVVQTDHQQTDQCHLDGYRGKKNKLLYKDMVILLSFDGAKD